MESFALFIGIMRDLAIIFFTAAAVSGAITIRGPR